MDDFDPILESRALLEYETRETLDARWARATTRRMQPGGDLYRRPLTRAQMAAPLAWHERQLAVCRRHGVLDDDSTGWLAMRDDAPEVPPCSD